MSVLLEEKRTVHTPTGPPTPDLWESHPPHDIDDFWSPLLLLSLLPLVLGIFWGLVAVAAALVTVGVVSLVGRSSASDENPEDRQP